MGVMASTQKVRNDIGQVSSTFPGTWRCPANSSGDREGYYNYFDTLKRLGMYLNRT